MSTAAASINLRELFSPEQSRQSRAFHTLDRSGIDAEKFTVPLSFSSEFPVLRYDMRGGAYYEVLDHAHVDTRDITDGAPLLYGHDRRDHLGVVDAVAFGPDKKGRALVRFSRNPFPQEKFRDVQDGILTKTSVGYDLGNADPVSDGTREGIPVIRFRNWRPYEVTLTPLPADNTVGVGRSKTTNTSPSTSMSATTTTEPEKPVVTSTTDFAAERQRIKDLNGAAKVLAERHADKADAFYQLARTCGEQGLPIADFYRTVNEDILATKTTAAPVRQSEDAARVGLSKRDLSRYSILRAVRNIVDNKPIDGLERECNDELAKKLDRQPQGFFVPDEVIARDRATRTHTAEVPADGGFTVGTTQLDSEFVTLLRNQAKVVGLGARYISGLQGDVKIPRQLTGATAYWVSETGSITAGSGTFGQIVSKPRRIGTSVPYSKQWLAQSSLAAEAFVTNDSDEAIAVELDRVAINGAGGKEPLGILNLATGDRSTSVTFGGAATWAKYVEFWTNVATNNAILGSPAYLTTPASASKAMTIAKFSSTGFPIWDNDKIGVFRADWSNQFPSSGTVNQVIFGDFSQVIYLEWAGRDVVVDPYSGKKEGTVEITIQRLIDMIIRRGKSFAISSDTGAA
jgi:HK97 family phage major capsid protein